MTVRDLQHLLRPQRVVQVPAQPPTPPWTKVVSDNLRGYPSAPDGPYLAVICLPQPDLTARLERLAGDACRAAVLVGGGVGPFSLDPAAAAAIHATARRLGVRLIGPTRVGVAVPGRGLCAGSIRLDVRDGPIAFVTQSDSMATAVVDWAATRRIGFSAIVATGDSPDGELGDIIDALAQDRGTRAVLLHVKGVGDARRFLSAARAAARTKPLIVLKTPDDDSDHEAVFNAAFERTGAIRVNDMRALFTAAGALAGVARSVRVGRGRLAIVSNGNASGLQARHTLLALGGTEIETAADASQPIDLGLEIGAQEFGAAVDRLVNASSGVDAVLACLAPGGPEPPEAYAQAMIGTTGLRRARPLLAAWLGGATTRPARELLGAAGIPAYATPEEAASAFMFKVVHERRQALLMQMPSGGPPPDSVDRALAGHAIERHDAMALLRAYGFRHGVGGGGISLHLAIRTDVTFGPYLTLGLGGPARRVAGTPVMALPPLSEPLAAAALAQTELGRRLLSGGTPGLPPRAVVTAAMVQLAEVAVAEADIVELDLDPVLVADDGLVVADARMVVVPLDPSLDPMSRLAIRPYPIELEEVVRLRDGAGVRLRPVRPEDADGMVRLFAALDPEDRRLRLFATTRELPPELAARLTQIDYDRELALVAETPQAPGELLAGARVIMDPDGATAEFAITVRSDQKRRGLGRLCLGRVIEHARRRGVAEVWGEILAENRGMLQLAGNLGFKLRREPDEPEIMRASLVLRSEPDRVP